MVKQTAEPPKNQEPHFLGLLGIQHSNMKEELYLAKNNNKTIMLV